jgi:beta-glucanase (GH16 family)
MHRCTVLTLTLPLLGLLSCRPQPSSGDSSGAKLAATEQLGRPAGYQLVWADEFEGEGLDTTKWGYPSYKEREGTLVNTPGTAVVKGGQLQLHTLQREGRLHCAILDTKSSRRFLYGYFEARVQFQHQQGHHGCFWLQSPTIRKGDSDPAGAGTEINIMEWFGSGRRKGWAGMNVYYYSGGHVVRSPSVPEFQLMGGPDEAQPQQPLADLSTAFHLYALHWTPESLRFYCDGRLIMEEREAISQVPEFMVISLLSSEWERARLDTTRLPDPMRIDYVRVFQDPQLAKEKPGDSAGRAHRVGE